MAQPRTTQARATAEPTRQPARSTRLEAEGAEFLVLGSLLIEGIPAWKAYSNFPGYDILAGDIAKHRICRIQVKSRFETGASGFPIGNFDCDFVCFVRLNRGSRTYLRLSRDGRDSTADLDDGRQPPEVYVLPTRIAKQAWKPGAPFGRGGILLKNIYKPDRYLHTWERINDFLATRPRSRRR
jgi:hypothetical protein